MVAAPDVGDDGIDLDRIDVFHPTHQRGLHVRARACTNDEGAFEGSAARSGIQQVRQAVCAAVLCQIGHELVADPVGDDQSLLRVIADLVIRAPADERPAESRVRAHGDDEHHANL